MFSLESFSLHSFLPSGEDHNYAMREGENLCLTPRKYRECQAQLSYFSCALKGNCLKVRVSASDWQRWWTMNTAKLKLSPILPGIESKTLYCKIFCVRDFFPSKLEVILCICACSTPAEIMDHRCKSIIHKDKHSHDTTLSHLYCHVWFPALFRLL